MFAGSNMKGIKSAEVPWILACATDFCFGKRKETSKQEIEYSKSFVKISYHEYWKVQMRAERYSEPACPHEVDNLNVTCKAYMTDLIKNCDHGGCVTGQCGRYCWAPS